MSLLFCRGHCKQVVAEARLLNFPFGPLRDLLLTLLLFGRYATRVDVEEIPRLVLR